MPESRDARFTVDRLGYGLSYLLSHGFPREDTWDGMERVRLGRGLPAITDGMALARDKKKRLHLCQIKIEPCVSLQSIPAAY